MLSCKYNIPQSSLVEFKPQASRVEQGQRPSKDIYSQTSEIWYAWWTAFVPDSRGHRIPENRKKKKKKKLDSVWSTFFEWVSTIYIHGFRSICICRQIDRISEISDWSACVSMQCAPRAPSVGFLFVSSLYHLNKLFEFLSFYNQKTNLSKSRCLKRIQYRLVSWIML